MPRTARASQGGYCYHVLNRGNGRAEVFHKEGDYLAFVRLMGQACERLPLRVVGWCLMPNHFHLVLWPYGDGDLSRWTQWLLTAHVRRYHRHYGGSGHVWQGRFKAFPIQEDEHLLAVLRYVERNALRANLVGRAQDWPYSSLALPGDDWPTLDPGPVPRGRRWLQHVNRPQTEAELKAIRHSLTRGTPYGSADWQAATARQLGLESTLRPRGRPRKSEKK
jgi:putative transposase